MLKTLAQGVAASRIPRAELERRWMLVREELTARQLDVLVVISRDDLQGGLIRWLTDNPAYCYNRAVMFFPNDWMSVIDHGPQGARRTLNGHDSDHPGVSSIRFAATFPAVNFTWDYEAAIVIETLKARGCSKVGVAGLGQMPFAFAAALQEAGGGKLFDLTDFLDLCRARKSAYELETMQATAAMQDRVFAELLNQVAPGMRYAEIAGLAQCLGRRYGSEQGVFLCGGAALDQPCMMEAPHFQGGVFREGQYFRLLIENNGAEGYYTELARTVVAGKAPDSLKEGFDQAREIQQATIESLTLGTPYSEIYRTHSVRLESLGIQPERRLYAHSQGYDIVERPLIREEESMVVEANSCLAIHPGFVKGASFGAVCDNYVIGENGMVSPIHQTAQRIFELA